MACIHVYVYVSHLWAHAHAVCLDLDGVLLCCCAVSDTSLVTFCSVLRTLSLALTVATHHVAWPARSACLGLTGGWGWGGGDAC